jgi:superfamily II DNA/RNA helicase
MGNHEIGITSADKLLESYKKPRELGKFLERTRHIVFDEADWCISDGSGLDALTKLISQLKAMKKLKETQFVFAAATLAPVKNAKSRNPRALVQNLFPGIVTVNSGSLHSTSPNLVEQFVDCKSDEDRYTLLAQTLARIADGVTDGKPKRLLVFCNTVASSEACLKYLTTTELENCSSKYKLAHGGLDKDERTKGILTYASGLSHNTKTDYISAKQLDILVCTDIVNRGVDFKQIDAIIHFNFPTDAATYIHRVGRACREAGATAICITT